MISIIRNRGQLTIPDSIRKIATWVSPLSAVTITVTKPDEIIIRPHLVERNKYDWNSIWANIKAARAIKGQHGLSAARILQIDRQNH